MMSIVAKLEELPTPMWIGLAVLGLMFWWPLELGVLAYLMWSGRMMCCGFGVRRWNDRAANVGQAEDWRPQPRTSGNRAFDEYRAETLRRLEEEHRAFQEFLARLRMAKDKAEFDQFAAERSNRSQPEPLAQS